MPPRLLAVPILALLLGLAGCGPPHGGSGIDHARLARSRAILMGRENAALRAMLADSRHRPLIPFDQALVVVRQELIESLLNSITPYSYVVAGKYRVRIDSVTVRFHGGSARVRLDGRASLADHPERDVFADVRLLADLGVEQIDPVRGVLRTRLHVIDVETRAVGVMGILSPGRRFVNDLAGQRLDQFRRFGADLEIPVRLEQSVSLPQVGPAGGVFIPTAKVPLRITIPQVRALEGRLWISVGISTGLPQSAVVVVASHTEADSSMTVLPLDRLAAEHARLRADLDTLVARDSTIQAARRDSGNVQIGIRPGVVEGLVAEIARRYLSRVSLDLSPDSLEVRESGDLHTRLGIANVNAGRWNVRMRVRRIQATLMARDPDIHLIDRNRIHLSFPVGLQDGRANADLDFGWRPHSLVSVVCKGFQTHQKLEGTVLAGGYRIDGDFELGSSGTALFAWPRFPRQKFRLRADLTPPSWAKVHAALESQNRLSRCGLLLNPDKVVADLHGLGNRGFLVKLPQSLFRTIVLPASLSESVAVGGHTLELALRRSDLRISPQSLWYSADVHSRQGAGSKPGVRGAQNAARSGSHP